MIGSLELELPALPEFVSTARLFIGDVGRHFGVSEDSVDDLKVAVSEACTAAISAQGNGNGNGKPVTVSVRLERESMSIEVTGAAGFEAPPEPAAAKSDIAADLGIGLVMALFPGARLDNNAAGTTLKLSAAARKTGA